MRPAQWAQLLSLPTWLQITGVQAFDESHGHPPIYDGEFGVFGYGQEVLESICPDYTRYAVHFHKPYSLGSLRLPTQRPLLLCRSFSSPAVEKVIEDILPKFKDPDLAKLFNNAFPNTLDTTVRWHVDGEKTQARKSTLMRDRYKWGGAQSFIVTGDINAEWLRDSTNQLAQYQLLAKTAPDISNLILGAINTQAEFVVTSPYCNAFQPPDPSGLKPVHQGQDDIVHPGYEPSVVFECKYELDSLAGFLSLSNQYHSSTGSLAFLTNRWYEALDSVLHVLDAQAKPTFDSITLAYERNQYSFSRATRTGTETLNLDGIGNPLAGGTGLVRSAFRPSDDATIFGFLIPANAMMSVELSRTAKLLQTAAEAGEQDIASSRLRSLADSLRKRSKIIKDGIYQNAVVMHPVFGKVFAYEVDGYGSHLLIDDANVPSLLSLPLLGFVDVADEIYQNTRKMILSTQGNPYYLTGPEFKGIGGPHIGLRNAWPMSALVQAMTSTDDVEIMECLGRVKNVSVFGLINESVDVERGVNQNGGGDGMTRSWFAWANSVFAQTILWLAEKKPDLIFEPGSGRYVVGKGFIT